MKAVIKREKSASVTVNNQIQGKIDYGFVVLLGITHEDTMKDVEYIVNKVTHLRVFEDESQKMNLSLRDVEGSILSISQFTLYGDTRKGRRPSFTKAAKPDYAKALYESFNQSIEHEGINIETG